ncbi:MAG: nucleotidyl transferase AbiEii/AbiGii toxin family protein [Candidatus Aminicenantes bacterium]|jgi:hypothetical protein
MKAKPIDPNLISRISQKEKFEESAIEKVLWISRILEYFMNTKLKKEFALMGGSAIAFLYEKVYRLSLDIDLDYVGNPGLGKGGSDEIQQVQERHLESIKDIAKSLGLKVMVEPRKDPRFLQIHLQFPSIYGMKPSIDLDLGYRYCHSVLDLQEKEWPKTFVPSINDKSVNTFTVFTLAPEELWASKIVATIGGERIDFEGKTFLGSKNKIRHLYDVYYFVKEILTKEHNIDLNLLKKIVVLFGATRIDQFEFFRGDLITTYNYEDVDYELFPILKKTQTIPELQSMKREVRYFLDKNIYNWGKKEYRFFEDFSARLFRPEDLFGKGKLSNRLKKMYYYDEILGNVQKRK